MDIRIADFDNEDVRELIASHQRRAYDSSPPGTSFALNLSGLQRPEITLFEAREGDRLLGIGALMGLSDGAGEVKSMRTGDGALRRGVGSAILVHIEAEARRRGFAKIFIETGVGETYAPANALYRRHGFAERGPFGNYAKTGFNIFYEKRL